MNACRVDQLLSSEVSSIQRSSATCLTEGGIRMEPIDLKKKYKELYRAKETPSQVVAPDCAFLSIDGMGRPGGEAYHEAIQKLYGVPLR